MSHNSQAVTKCVWWQQIMLGMFALGFTSSLWAQSTPTADQLKIFNNLDPATQQSILQNMGQGNTTAGTTQTDTKTNTSNDQRRRNVNGTNKRADNKQNELPLVPVLKPG